MTQKRYKRSKASEVEGFQHGHDDYWFQPVVFGKSLYTHLVSVPPNGYMPAHGHAEDPHEFSYFHVDGELELTLDNDTFTVRPGDAIHIAPGVSLGVRNTGDTIARFLMTYSPAPRVASLQEARERAVERGTGVRSPSEMQRLTAVTREAKAR